MGMRKKIARLFTIKTPFEAYLVTYAIAVGSVERGSHYLAQYPGAGGWLLFAACLGLPFIAGAKLLDSVRKEPAVPAIARLPHRRRAPRFGLSRNRPRSIPTHSGSGQPTSHRTD
jgi:hypothetical protein